MKLSIYASIFFIIPFQIYAQHFHVQGGTSWFQGDNTPLPGAAGRGIAIGFPTGGTGGYIFSWDYSSFTGKDLWLQHGQGNVLVGHFSATAAAKLDVRTTGQRAIYVRTNQSEAIYGFSSGGNGITGVSSGNVGVYGINNAGSAGVLGDGDYIGTQGNATGTNVNRQGVRGDLIGNAAGGYAGLFNGGTTWVVGTLQKNAGAFIIDHPLEPESKYLMHSFVESPDMKNIYDGVAITDENGLAEIQLPAYFEALNMEFRYQLTCIGKFAQAIIQEEISENQFTIRTDQPEVKVSWQVTGIRHDPYAVKHRIPVEKEKEVNERGKYIFPAGYGKSSQMSLDLLKPVPIAQRKSLPAER